MAPNTSAYQSLACRGRYAPCAMPMCDPDNAPDESPDGCAIGGGSGKCTSTLDPLLSVLECGVYTCDTSLNPTDLGIENTGCTIDSIVNIIRQVLLYHLINFSRVQFAK